MGKGLRVLYQCFMTLVVMVLAVVAMVVLIPVVVLREAMFWMESGDGRGERQFRR